jgi:hypothetical protein
MHLSKFIKATVKENQQEYGYALWLAIPRTVSLSGWLD